MMQLLPLNSYYVDWFSHLLPNDMIPKLKAGTDYVGIGVILDDTACGVLCVFVDDDLVEIRYLFVSPDFRRRGMATSMLNTMAKRCSAILLPLMGYISADDHSDPLFCFFNELSGFTFVVDPTGDKTYGVPMAQLAPIAKKPRHSQVESVPFHTLSGPLRRRFYKTTQEEGFPFIADYDVAQARYIPELTRCFLDEAGLVSSAIFFEATGPKTLSLSFLYTRPGAQKQMADLLSTCAQRILQSPYREGMLAISPVSERAQRLFDNLFPQKTVLSELYMICQDLDQWEDE